jgi:hypothetical protein
LNYRLLHRLRLAKEYGRQLELNGHISSAFAAAEESK